MKRWRWAIISAVAALALTACGDNSSDGQAATGTGGDSDQQQDDGGGEDESPQDGGGEEDKNPLVIGYAATLSGFSANADSAGMLGAETMVAKLNAQGGIDGHPVELIVKDMKSDPSLGGTVAQELLDAGAAVILGPPFPGQAAGVIQAAGAAGVPVLSVTSTGPEYTEVGGHPAFLTTFGDNAQAAAVAEWVLEQGAKTSFYMTSPDLNYTSKNAEWFADAFEQGGGENLGSETFSVGQEDFSAQVTKIAGLDPHPDAVYASMFMPDVGVFVQQLRSAGYDGWILGGDGYDNEAFVDFVGDAAGKIAFSTQALAVADSRVAEFIGEVTEHNGGEAPNQVGLTALGGDAILIVQAAVEAAGSIEPAAIADALKNLDTLEVITGEVTYAGTNGVPIHTVVVATVEDGAITFADAFVPGYVPSAN